MMEASFGEIVRREREGKNWSLAELSERLNELGEFITPSYINRLENKKQSNPSFKVVAALSRALNLDIREVFRAFGYESLIVGYDENAEFTIEELIRLHKIKPPVTQGMPDESKSDRLLNKEEQESLIRIIHITFEYITANNDVRMDKLVQLLQEIQHLRDLQQKNNSLQVTFMNVTFTVQIDALLKNNEHNIESLKEDIQKEIAKKGSRLLDIPSGMILLSIRGQKWLAKKEANIIKLLAEYNDVIAL
jgi:transcriptional regulator with XRE-family HTH domain